MIKTCAKQFRKENDMDAMLKEWKSMRFDLAPKKEVKFGEEQ